MMNYGSHFINLLIIYSLCGPGVLPFTFLLLLNFKILTSLRRLKSRISSRKKHHNNSTASSGQSSASILLYLSADYCATTVWDVLFPSIIYDEENISLDISFFWLAYVSCGHVFENPLDGNFLSFSLNYLLSISAFAKNGSTQRSPYLTSSNHNQSRIPLHFLMKGENSRRSDLPETLSNVSEWGDDAATRHLSPPRPVRH